MTDLRTAAQQALETLEALQGGCTDSDDGTVEAITVWCPEIIEALEAALAEPVQEPVAWSHNLIDNIITHRPADIDRHPDRWTPLYTASPQRKPLSGVAIYGLFVRSGLGAYHQKDFVVQTEYDRCIERFARAIERAHGIGSSDVGT